jgi:hypothetical protein
MTIRTISYSESRESAVGYLKQWKKFGAEAELSERESPEEAMETLRALIGKKLDDAHQQVQYDSVISDDVTTNLQMANRKPDPKQDRVQQLIRDINACTAVDERNSFGVQVGLISFSGMASTNPDLQTAYDNKLQELNQ